MFILLAPTQMHTVEPMPQKWYAARSNVHGAVWQSAVLYIPKDSSAPGEGHHSPHTCPSTVSAFCMTTVGTQINPSDIFLSTL